LHIARTDILICLDFCIRTLFTACKNLTSWSRSSSITMAKNTQFTKL
jgi:hypothetical protein